MRLGAVDLAKTEETSANSQAKVKRLPSGKSQVERQQSNGARSTSAPIKRPAIGAKEYGK